LSVLALSLQEAAPEIIQPGCTATDGKRGEAGNIAAI
jgi:hypothetical protein